jgi:DNA polymerase III alpha subunit
VIEKTSEGALIPGLIIPDLTINYGDILKIGCIAQVVYRREEKESKIRCGLTILDMDIKGYNDLLNILTKANSPHISISSEVDMDALREFFFDTGFIYPQKYHLVQTYRKDLRTIYREFY